MKRMKLVSTSGLALCAALAAAQAWTCFGGNPQRTGRTTAVIPNSPVQKWSFDLKGPMISSPVVAQDGTIYTGSVWWEGFVPNTYVTAINPDGTLKWRYESGWLEDQSLSTPAIGPGGEIYFGTADGYFYALSSAGQLLWRYPASSNVNSQPVVAPNGTIYVYLGEQLTAFNPNGTVQWQHPLGRNVPGGPTLGTDGTIYAVASTGVIALWPNGTLRWTSAVGGSVAPPVVSQFGDVLVAGTYLNSLDAATGNLRWTASPTFGMGNYGMPGVDAQGNVFYTAYVYIWKFDRFGATVWERQFLQGNRLGQSYSSIAVDGAGKIVHGMGSGKRWAIDIEKRLVIRDTNGNEVATFNLPECTSNSSPAIGPDGTAYIGCLDGRLYAFGASFGDGPGGGRGRGGKGTGKGR